MPLVVQEQETSRISRIWKISQIIFHFIAFVGSMLSCVPFENARNSFNGHCMLYANPLLSFQDGQVIVDDTFDGASMWGSNITCQFCLYLTVASAIYAFIFGWFYAVCPRGGRPKRWVSSYGEFTEFTDTAEGNSEDVVVGNLAKPVRVPTVESSPRKPWRLLFPSLVFSCNFTFIMIAVSLMMNRGTTIFCENLVAKSQISCGALADVPWVQFPNIRKFHDNLVLAQLGSWVSVVGWCAVTCVNVLRCCLMVDFVAEKYPKRQFMGFQKTQLTG